MVNKIDDLELSRQIVYNAIKRFDWNPGKQKLNLLKHSLDFADAQFIFNEPVLCRIDKRKNYGEERFIAIGKLDKNIVVLVYTLRQEICRIISLRKAGKNEKKKYGSWLNKHEEQDGLGQN